MTIVNNTVNDVALTVLPDAPIDPATGLPVPTIAVATDGGVSVIKDDGTVVNSASTRSYSDLAILDTFAFHAIWGVGESTDYFNDIRNLSSSFTTSRSFNSATVPKLNVAGQVSTEVTAITGGFVQGTIANKSLNVVAVNPADVSKSSVAYISSTYNTGWLPGDIKGAFLADTDDTDLVGSGELVTNGTFDTDTSGWTDASEGTGSISWDASGALSLNNPAASSDEEGLAYQVISTVVGESYTLVVSKSGGKSITQIGTAVGTSTFYQSANSISDVLVTFVPTTTTTYITLRNFNNSTPALVDNISVKLADADRSVNNNGLIVNGTVTRSAVATGADLVAYSGFSASNFLEQPYNSDLDFGTDDFCVMGWVKGWVAAADVYALLSRQGTNPIRFGKDSATNKLAVFQTGRMGEINSVAALDQNSWSFIAFVRSGSDMNFYINGAFDSSAAMSNWDMSLANGALQVGTYGGTSRLDGSASLLRISATAPTADQIAKIYEDEKFLFQDNAACTIYGSSDAVTALAHDPDTNLLHVGTSAGRSVFQGLKRVDNTTAAVGTAISASGALVVEE